MKKPRDQRLDVDKDFILSPKHDNSLNRLLDENPSGVPDSVICKVLDLTPESLQATYDGAILKLQEAMRSSGNLVDDTDL
jgi:hypothetical protein